MLDDLKDLVAVLEKNPDLFAWGDKRISVVAASVYCPKCGDTRKVTVNGHYAPHWPPTAMGRQASTPPGPFRYLPALGRFTCVQCSTQFTWVIYQGPAGPALAVLPSTFAGISTPHTPGAVAYYLDQAHRAHALGAHSAAVAMYRAATEQLLYDQGFTAGMLAAKIAALEAAISQNVAPRWAAELDTDFLTLIKDLGNGSVHPNSGDITKQASLDAELVQQLTALFSYLLFSIYEAPAKSTALKSALAAKAAILRK